MISELEHALVSAVISDIKPREASERMLAFLSKTLGGTCDLVPGHVAEPASETTVSYQFGSLDDPSATTLHLTGEGVRSLGEDDRERIRKMFLALHELAYPIPRGAKSVHQLRNRLTGVLTNIELIEMYVVEAEGGGIGPDQIPELQVSVRHALASCREMADIVRNLGGFVDASRVKKLSAES